MTDESVINPVQEEKEKGELFSIGLVEFLRLIESAYKSHPGSYARLEISTGGAGKIVGHTLGEETILEYWETETQFETALVSIRRGAEENFKYAQSKNE